MASGKDWFDIDRRGLAAIAGRHGVASLVFELYQNAVDEKVTSVKIALPRPEHRKSRLEVEDDSPEGFQDLTHAWTLFAPSSKRSDPGKRGRFNLGEKLVLASCIRAEVSTTTGTVTFDEDGRKVDRKRRRERGSVFSGEVRMTVAEWEEACLAVRSLLPPAGVEVAFNGEALPRREPQLSFETTLPTEILKVDGEGNEVMRRTERKTTVSLVEPAEGERPMLYELGIPVVELPDDRWHVDVGQKVPLALDRRSVTAGWLRTLRVAVLNAAHPLVKGESAASSWVKDATDDPRCSDDAIKHVITEQYGDKVASYDPRDPESKSRAQSMGWEVLHGSVLSKGQWDNLRRAGAVVPASKVAPTRPESFEAPVSAEVTPGMEAIARYSREVARRILKIDLEVDFLDNPDARTVADYGGGGSPGKRRTLRYNVGRLGAKFFERGATEEVNRLLIHELAHERGSNHLTHDYHAGLEEVGAGLVRIALEDPLMFKLAEAKKPQSGG